jgi:hypothetical protein
LTFPLENLATTGVQFRALRAFCNREQISCSFLGENKEESARILLAGNTGGLFMGLLLAEIPKLQGSKASPRAD